MIYLVLAIILFILAVMALMFIDNKKRFLAWFVVWCLGMLFLYIYKQETHPTNQTKNNNILEIKHANTNNTNIIHLDK